MSQLREAVEDDLAELVDMGEDFAAAAGVAFEMSAAVNTFRKLISDDSMVLLVAEDDGGIIGAIGGLLYGSIFSEKQRIAQEVFWWIRPAARRSRAGVELLKRFEEWAIAHGADSITMLCLEALKPDSVARVYERRGYRALERSFTKDLH